ncbi:MAG: thioredoxin family protein [Bryobacteraceae bacterium]
MTRSSSVFLMAALCLLGSSAGRGQEAGKSIADDTGSFAPLTAWTAAIEAGDRAALASFYSTNPQAVVLHAKDKVTTEDELQYWGGLKSSGLTEFHPKVLDSLSTPPRKRLLLRIEAVKDGQSLVGSMLQMWEQQPGGWRLIVTRRFDFSPNEARRLPQPAKPNPNLYPAPGEAQTDLTAALDRGTKENKRVLVVFGANWCYDCHVLDTTFHSKDFASLVDDNYVVVHINLGDEGKDNHDLADRLGVALNRGIPSLAVLNPDGTVVVAQKNGEFESTVKIGPEEVRAFLIKWKPAR